MSEMNENSGSVRKTKEERFIAVFSLFVFSLLYVSFLIFYPKPDAEYLIFARLLSFFSLLFFGFMSGIFLIRLIGGRKYVKQKNTPIQITAIAAVLGMWGVFVILSGVLSGNILDPADSRERILILAGSLFVAGILIQIFAVYTDDIIEKISANKSDGENAASQAVKQTKANRFLNIYWIFVLLFFFFFLLSYSSDSDSEFLRMARNLGYSLTGWIGWGVGLIMIDAISRRKRTKSKNIGFQLLSGFIIAAVMIFIILWFDLIYHSYMDRADYFSRLLTYSAVFVIGGACISMFLHYTDDFVEKYVSKKMRF